MLTCYPGKGTGSPGRRLTLSRLPTCPVRRPRPGRGGFTGGGELIEDPRPMARWRWFRAMSPGTPRSTTVWVSGWSTAAMVDAIG
jgi:hypothetical protein